MAAVVDSLHEPVTETEMHLFCVEMMKRLNMQRRNEHFCDVILEVGSGDDQARLKAHRVVLCAASPFFNNALNSDMKEKKEGVIRLQETSKAVMEEVLEYLYTGHVDINEHNAFDLMLAADFLLIPSLKALCSNAILQTLTFSNSIAAYYLAVKYRCDELERKVRDFILSNFVAVAETEDFLNLSSKQVVEWISSDGIILKGEEEVFEALIKWIGRDESRKQSVPDLFRHIRCIYISRSYLLNVILPSPFIKDNLECSNFVLDAIKMVFSGEDHGYLDQLPRNCLKTHEDAIIVTCAATADDTFCYVPSRDNWYELADRCSSGIQDCCAMSSCNGKLFFIGGTDCSAERYDPSVNAWSPLVTSFKQTIQFATAVTFQGFLYVIGGKDKDNELLSTVQRYNPDTNLWQAMPSLSSPRSSVCAVADGNHLYAIGGNSGSGYLDIAEKFYPKEKSWSRIASSLEKRGGAGGAAVNQKVFVFGGLRDEAPDSKACEMYDQASNTWSIIPNMAGSPRGCATAVSLQGKIFVFGEFKEDDDRDKMLKCFDIDKNEWTSCSDYIIFHDWYIVSSLRIPRDVLNSSCFGT